MATVLKCLKEERKIKPMIVAGDRCCAEAVLWGMIESSDALVGMDFTDFSFTEIDSICLDPGGMCFTDDASATITIMGVDFTIYQQHLIFYKDMFRPDAEVQVRLPNWIRFPVWGANVYIPEMIRGMLYERLQNTAREMRGVAEEQVETLRKHLEELRAENSDAARGLIPAIEAKLRRRELELRCDF